MSDASYHKFSNMFAADQCYSLINKSISQLYEFVPNLEGMFPNITRPLGKSSPLLTEQEPGAEKNFLDSSIYIANLIKGTFSSLGAFSPQNVW